MTSKMTTEGTWVCRCSDDTYISIPRYAHKYCSFFAALEESVDDDFWAIRDSPVPHKDPEPLPVPRAFSISDPNSGNKMRVRFIP
jgi:hypothetical protein